MDKKCEGCMYNLDEVCHFDDDKGCALDQDDYIKHNQKFYKWDNGCWVEAKNDG